MSALWDELSGQDRVRELLSLAAVEPSGAYLFVGPAGVGKGGAARIFASAILCREQCGVCSICTRVLKGAHPDVQWFEPEGLTYPVSLIREVVASASLTPMEGSRRVIVVDEADRIVERSQNALLKALEEPGLSVTWILVAEAIDVFLPTILSRCQIVEFAVVPEETVGHILRSRFILDDEATSTILRAAAGNLERALALAGDEDARGLRKLAIDAASNPPLTHEVFAAVEAVRDHAAAARDQLAAEQSAELSSLDEVHGPGPWRRRVERRHTRALRAAELQVYQDFLVWLGTAFRDLAVMSTGGGPEQVASPDRVADLSPAADKRPTAFWIEMVEEVLEAQKAVRENANGPLAIEAILLRAASEWATVAH
ncbi:MAG: ATP-binding protein [Actinomycetota bacterium]